MIVYLLLGFVGLPVFSGGRSGLGVLAGSTGGYLIGFVICAIVVGSLVERKKHPGFLWYCMSMAAGTLALYACGAAWLAVIMRWDIMHALIIGALPFVPGDIIKIVVAAFIAKRVNKGKPEGSR
jgi:biotin transport system substrate-specific component